MLFPRIKNHCSSFELGVLNIIFCTIECWLVCHSYYFCYGATNMARKMSKKYIRFDFSQSENRKYNRKNFEIASMASTKRRFDISNFLYFPQSFVKPTLTGFDTSFEVLRPETLTGFQTFSALSGLTGLFSSGISIVRSIM